MTVSYYLESGESKDTLHFVPPHTRQTIDASADIGGPLPEPQIVVATAAEA